MKKEIIKRKDIFNYLHIFTTIGRLTNVSRRPKLKVDCKKIAYIPNSILMYLTTNNTYIEISVNIT